MFAADGFEQRAAAVEVDAIAFFEISLRLAGDDAGEVKDQVGFFGDEGVGGALDR